MVGPPLQMIPLVKMARGIFLVISVWLWRLPALIRLRLHLQSRRPGIDPFLKTVFQTGLHSLCLEVFEWFPFPLGLIVSGFFILLEYFVLTISHYVNFL